MPIKAQSLIINVTNRAIVKLEKYLILDGMHPCISPRVSHYTLLVTSSLSWLVTHMTWQRKGEHPAWRHIVIRGGRGHVECHNKYEKWHCDGPGSMGPSKDQSYAKWTHLMVIYYHTSRSENKNINTAFSSFSFYHPRSCVDIFGDKVDWFLFLVILYFRAPVYHTRKCRENVVVQGLNH